MRTLLHLLTMSLPTLLFGQAEWQQMTSCPGAGRYWAAATGNSTVAIAGTGRLQFSGTDQTVGDMWLYTAATDSWEAIPDYPGGVRQGATAFTIGERLFMGFGSPFIQFSNDLYEYLPATNTWEQMPSVPGVTGFAYSHGFVIGNTFFLGPENGVGTVYAFNADTETWSTVAPFPGQDRRAQCTFSAGGKGYLGMGMFVFGGVLGDWWEYDPLADSWTEVQSITPVSDQSTATEVNGRGYVFNVGANQKNLYAYAAPEDEWQFQSTLPTERISNATLFTIGGHGYLVFGQKSSSGGSVSSNELWRFTPQGTTAVAELDQTPELGVRYLGDGGVQLLGTQVLAAQSHLELVDGTGRLVLTRTLPAGAPVDLLLPRDLAPGAYTAMLQAGDVRDHVRLVMP